MRDFRRTLQSGFSLIELMIVIAIVGILASIAVPSYNTYVIKARVSEMLSLASAPKAVVVQNIAENALLTLNGVAAATIGRGFTNATVGVVTSITISTAGAITIIGNASTGSTTINLTPTYNAGGLISWSCTGNPTTYLPASCGG